MGTSWKMNKTLAEARDYAQVLAAALQDRPHLTSRLKPFLIPPATALAAVRQQLDDAGGPGAEIPLGIQNAHWEDAGSWTGEISVPQALDAGAEIIEIGHSERRQHFGETAEITGLKVRAALRHDAVALLCIGEPEQIRDADRTTEYLLEQADAALGGLSQHQLSRVLIAYEPVWAIGPEGRPAAPDELTGAFAALHQHYGHTVKALLYGGSVTHSNVAALLTVPHVGGLFIGRAAWQPHDFIQLLELAAETPHLTHP
ncbi:triose-phosphate isomerase [Nesterenkonia alkaliphila]|uniref:Triosephosphate isomerase n=1 Tax=Nesterenkonia alkaliphila TaxID=1463631 RepID=A0A7K1UG03_9MICC|nr:triose-phosphate isomerase [Nesterenkonia alkaliphila]